MKLYYLTHWKLFTLTIRGQKHIREQAHANEKSTINMILLQFKNQNIATKIVARKCVCVQWKKNMGNTDSMTKSEWLKYTQKPNTFSTGHYEQTLVGNFERDYSRSEEIHDIESVKEGEVSPPLWASELQNCRLSHDVIFFDRVNRISSCRHRRSWCGRSGFGSRRSPRESCKRKW